MAEWFFVNFRNNTQLPVHWIRNKMDKDNGYHASIDHMIMYRKQKTLIFDCAKDKIILHVHTKMVSWHDASYK